MRRAEVPQAGLGWQRFGQSFARHESDPRGPYADRPRSCTAQPVRVPIQLRHRSMVV